MTELVIEAHRRKIPIDHPYRSITREHLEYPTVDVTFTYLSVIDKVSNTVRSLVNRSAVLTLDSFTDKAIEGWVAGVKPDFIARCSDYNNGYLLIFHYPPASTADHCIYKITEGVFAKLAEEAVDLDENDEYQYWGQVVGSALSTQRPTGTSRLSATDTDHSSGVWGICAIGNAINQIWPERCWLRAPASPLPPAQRILEIEITGSGTEDDPIRPNFSQELVEISRLTNLPDFLKKEVKRYEMLKAKGFTYEEIKLLLGYIPQHQVDLSAVTWGSFDYKGEETMLCVITADNPYQQGAIQKQEEYAKSKGLKVLKPPKDYREACEQYRQLRKDFTGWLAGKDNYAYQTLGFQVLDYFQVADTYYGRIIEMGDAKAYKDVPDWEMRRTINMWKEKLEKVNVLKEEAEKHLKKLKEVEKKGW